MTMLTLVIGLTQAHAAPSSTAPWEACEGRTLDQACSYEVDSRSHRGHCQSVRDALICAPTQPAAHAAAPAEVGIVTSRTWPALALFGLVAAGVLFASTGREIFKRVSANAPDSLGPKH